MTAKSACRLLIVAPAGAHIRNFLDRVENKARAIHIITNKPPDFKTNHQVTIVDFSLKNPLNFLSTPRKIKEVYKEFEPDIIHVHQLNSVSYYTLRALRNSGTPIVATAWGSDVLVLPEKGVVYKGLVRYALKHATVFTSDSTFMAQKMRDLLPDRNLDITICNFGVAPPVYDLPKENIIYSNRLHKPLYRVDSIIEAFSKFRNTSGGKSWRLVIAATGPETPALKELAKELGVADQIQFEGWLEREDNMKWYARSKVWVSVPESDATAISLLEAMYYGCFPIVVDLPASHEWIEDGENGLIVYDVESAFLSGIEEVNFKSASEMNKQIIEKEGTYMVAEKKFGEIYCKLLTQ